MVNWIQRARNWIVGRFPRRPPKPRSLPPKLSTLHKVFLFAAYSLSFGCLLYLSWKVLRLEIGSPNLCRDYVALGLLPLAIYARMYFKNDKRLHESRQQDPSEVDALFVEARKVYSRLEPELEQRPKPFDEKVAELSDEVLRLQELGFDSWTEYQLLSLNQMLVDFLKVDDLKERARSVLEDLEEYAVGTAVAYDLRKYDGWKARINDAIEKIPDEAAAEEGAVEFALRRDDSAEPLRARLKSLQEHVAGYEAYWSEGTTLVRGLIVVCCVTIPALLAMGLLPLMNGVDSPLKVLNWSFLGVAGALTAVLRALYAAEVVEVGSTEGRAQVWRTMVGGMLGLVAGVLTYGLVAAGVMTSTLVPNPEATDSTNVALTILWAFGGGFYLERVFERVRAATAAS